MYIYPPPCLRHAWGVFDPMCLLSWRSCSFKGPTDPGSGSSALQFSSLFVQLFQNLFFQTIGAKSPRNGSPERTKITKKSQKPTLKAHPSFGLAKKLYSGGVKPLKLMTVTHFQLFFRKPRAPKKSSKWEPKWSRRAPKSQKIVNSEHSKKR